MAGKKNALKKTNNHITLIDHKLPLYEISGKIPVSPMEIIPAFDNEKKGTKRTLGVRKSDLPKFSVPNAPAVTRSVPSFLDQFITVYYPLYGIYPFFSNARFYLQLNNVSYTNGDTWVFQGDNANGNETLSFQFLDQPNHWYYLKFEMLYAHCRLTINVGGSTSQLLVYTQGAEENFGIFVRSGQDSFSPTIEIMVERQYPENEVYGLALRSVSLYRTLRIPPGPVANHF